MIARLPPAMFGMMTGAMLLSACGDDLESRQAAVERQQSFEQEFTITPQPGATTSAADPGQPAEEPVFIDGAEEDDSNQSDDVPLEASPEFLIDNAEGFAPEPMDDTTGFDPTPTDPSGFAPEPIGPDSFAE